MVWRTNVRPSSVAVSHPFFFSFDPGKPASTFERNSILRPPVNPVSSLCCDMSVAESDALGTNNPPSENDKEMETGGIALIIRCLNANQQPCRHSEPFAKSKEQL
jgi:hypothetical protein